MHVQIPWKTGYIFTVSVRVAQYTSSLNGNAACATRSLLINCQVKSRPWSQFLKIMTGDFLHRIYCTNWIFRTWKTQLISVDLIWPFEFQLYSLPPTNNISKVSHFLLLFCLNLVILSKMRGYLCSPHHLSHFSYKDFQPFSGIWHNPC